MSETPPSPSERLKRSVLTFVRKMEGSKQAETVIMPLLMFAAKQTKETFEEFVREAKIDFNKEGTKWSYTVPVAKFTKFEKLKKIENDTETALFQTPRTLIVALVSCYDAYLGDLLKSLFYLRPEILNASERSFTFKQLVGLKNIEAAREFLTEKEVEQIIRKSHSDQIKAVENLFGLPLTKDLDIWPRFIELTERRNLFVHTDGIISTQYLEVCKANSVDVGSLKVGQKLGVSREYFFQAYNCIYELGVKLNAVLWRKVSPNDLSAADDALQDLTFSLLKNEEYKLAEKLLDFAIKLKRHSSNRTKRVFIVNLAIACKWGGSPERCQSIMEAEDWSDCAPEFELAAAVLKDDFEAAGEIMRRAGKDNQPLNEAAYEAWPLFREFKKDSSFLKAYGEIFGKDFIVEETNKRNQDIEKRHELQDKIGSEEPIRKDKVTNSKKNQSTKLIVTRKKTASPKK